MVRRHRLVFIFLAASLAGCIVSGASVVCRANITIDTVLIGSPGNANDPATGYGGVAYGYRIGKYDVTVGQYTAFLNAVAAADTYALYNPSLATDLTVAGIARIGEINHFSYSVIGSPNHPITYVSWGDAARFANWLHNGQPTGAEGPTTTETGAYTLNGATSDAALYAVSRNASAKWFIPSESEWYKAAYYDPAVGHYWSYATGSDTQPTSAPPGNTPNTANFFGGFTGYALTGSTRADNNQNYLTDVGAYTASASPYGTFDQSGNVFQWNEANTGGRGLRGDAWNGLGEYLRATSRFGNSPTSERRMFGLRVAAVAEPSALVLSIISMAVVALLCR